MRQVYGERYIAKSFKGDYELYLNPGETTSVGRVMDAIDKANRKALDEGYKPTTYVICREQAVVVHDDDGQFVMKTVTCVAVEKYPV